MLLADSLFSPLEQDVINAGVRFQWSDAPRMAELDKNHVFFSSIFRNLIIRLLCYSSNSLVRRISSEEQLFIQLLDLRLAVAECGIA